MDNKNKKLIILCGYTSSGKSTIGRALAKTLKVPFYDTDDMLTQTYTMSIQEIFAKGGEDYFRDLEHEIAQKAASLKNGVISTGGGMLVYERNAKLLKENGIIIYINRPFEDCYRFLSRHPERPLVRNNSKETLQKRYEERDKVYAKNADLIVYNKSNPHEVVLQIVGMLGSVLH